MTIPADRSRPLDTNADARARNWTQMTHLVGLLAALPGVSVAALVGTVAMWLIRRQESEFVDDHGREAANFQISILIYSIFGAIFAVVTAGLGAPVAAVAIGGLTLYGGIRGAMASGRGEYYRYPMCLRLLHEPEAPSSAGFVPPY
ncbi:MAG: DUF4870 domain-containing protein [Phycisphaerales bacterium]|nr:DUF4870 domain-containing protein [Phycisphaerales bacterium]